MSNEHGSSEHGPVAGYAGGPGKPYFRPVIECLCGDGSGRCDSFEEAGAWFDEHIKKFC